jgi:DNA-binding winged helix-turn-helix (wHTH) protein
LEGHAVTLRFGGCVLDTDTRELTRDGRPVPLSPKAYQLLRLLIDARPKALAKDLLYQSLWPDTFVLDTNLSNLIGEIRTALADSPQHPRFIRTLHGFGYAFSAAVTEVRESERSGEAIGGFLVLADGTAMPLPGHEAVIGRGPDAHVRLDLPGVSRRHARVVRSGDVVLLEDLQSKNGTFVAGERISAPRPLAHGDEVGFGTVRVTFCAAPTQPSTETVQRPAVEHE